MVVLPTTKRVAPAIIEPKRLVIFSHYKVGKTSNLGALPNSLIIDLEDGADSYACASLNIRRIATEDTDGNVLSALNLVISMLVKANTEAKKSVYDFIIIDTTSALELIARNFATYLYKQRPGNQYEGNDVVLELPNGAGWDWLRSAFSRIYNPLQVLAGKSLILLGHVKSSSINKNGKDLQVNDIMLSGKLKQIVCSDAFGTGYMYRNYIRAEDGTLKTSQNILSFQTGELDLATGARSAHLSGKEFIISEKSLPDGPVVTYWEKIFPSVI